MTLSIEDLPAPFGPRMAAPTFLPAFMSLREAGPVSRRLPRRGDTVGLCLHDSQVGRHRTRAAVLEAHLRLDEAARLVRVEGIDQHGVFLGDVAAAHLARARELAVVRVELLLQYEETGDLRVAQRRVAGKVAGDLFHAFAHPIVDRW